jgi:hypothetical protein
VIDVRRTVAGAIMLASLSLGACGKGDQGSESGYATDGNTGAASPNATPDYSATPNLGASTGAVASPAGGPAIAGDTMSKRTGASAAASGSKSP